MSRIDSAAQEAGRLHHVIRDAIRDLVRIDGFDRARHDVAAIINSEADRAGRYEYVAERS